MGEMSIGTWCDRLPGLGLVVGMLVGVAVGLLLTGSVAVVVFTLAGASFGLALGAVAWSIA